MKKALFIAFALTGWLLVGCGDSTQSSSHDTEEEQTQKELTKPQTSVSATPNKSSWYTIVVIDGCQYIMVNVDTLVNVYHGVTPYVKFSICHKGDCNNPIHIYKK